MKNLKDQSCNAQNIRSGEIAHQRLEKYKFFDMPHGKHIFQTSYDMDMKTMCAYISSKYALPHSNFNARCCEIFPHIALPDIESYQHNSNMFSTIIFSVKHNCTFHCA